MKTLSISGVTGTQGSDAEKLVGRPRLPEGCAKTFSMFLRTTPALGEKATRLAAAAGISRNEWIEDLIAKANA